MNASKPEQGSCDERIITAEVAGWQTVRAEHLLPFFDREWQTVTMVGREAFTSTWLH